MVYLGQSRPPATGAPTKTGGYAGDNAASRAHTGIGFQPTALFIFERDGSANQWIYLKTDQDGTTTKNSGGGFDANIIVSLDSDGFTTGSNTTQINETGKNYSFLAVGVAS